ncbi:hypothetical protein Vretimale_17493, partial [Volvox reticuliferus]
MVNTNAAAAAAAAATATNLPGLRSVAYLLDAIWCAEYDTHAWVASSMVTEPHDTQIRQQHLRRRRPAPFLELLQGRAWLPDSWGGCAAPVNGEVLPTSCRPLRALLGPTARYVGVELTDPRFTEALGLPTTPSLRCVLTQLRLWSRRDTSETPAATAAATVAAAAAAVSGPQSPSLVTLAGCYSYLSGLAAAEAAFIGGIATAVSQPQELAPEPEGLRKMSDGMNGGPKGSDGERAMSVIRAAFVHEPLIAVRKGADVGSSPAYSPLLPLAGVLHGGGGGGGSGTGTLRWCRAGEVVWSLGPLAELVSEPLLFGGGGAAASSSPAAAATSVLPPRLAETYPASLEPFFVGLLAVRHHPGPQHLLTALRGTVGAAEAAATSPATVTSAADAPSPVLVACGAGGRREAGAALMCLGWLGCLMRKQQQEEETRRPSGGGDSGGGGGGGGFEDVSVTPSGCCWEEVLAALRSEALMPTVDGRWVTAAPPVFGAVAASGTAVETVTGLTVVLDDVIAAAAAALAAGVVTVTDGAAAPLQQQQLLRDPLAAVAGLLAAARAGGCGRLDIIGPPLLPQGVDAQQELQLQPPLESSYNLDQVESGAAAAAAAGLRHLLCELLRLPTLGSVVHVRPHLMPDASAKSASEAPELAVSPPGAAAALHGIRQHEWGGGYVLRQSPVQRQQRLEAVATGVLRRLNDVAPYLRRWAAVHVGGGRGGFGGITAPATASPWRASSVAAGDWVAAASWLRVVAVGGGVGLVYELPALCLMTEPQQVGPALLLGAGQQPHAPGENKGPGRGQRETWEDRHEPHSGPGGPLLLVSCSGGVAETAGLVPEPECWRAVFEELPRLLFGGKRHSVCTRFLFLVHTLMEAGQTAAELEASVATLYGSLPRLAPEEEELCFGAAWYRKNADPDPDLDSSAEAAARSRDNTLQGGCIGTGDAGAGGGPSGDGSGDEDDALGCSGSDTGGDEEESISRGVRGDGGGTSRRDNRRRRGRLG